MSCRANLPASPRGQGMSVGATDAARGQPAVLPLADVRARDTAIAGGKAARLGELIAHGFPVPPGFVVPAHVYRQLIAAAALPAEIAALDAAATGEWARRSAEIQRRILDAKIAEEVVEAIRHAHVRLVAGRAGVACAVRSSATAEDLASASFAGQHGTYYYVDAANVVEMVRHCWASLWSAEAASYRASHAIPHAAVSMAVLVQELVRSDVSGVAFTAHPVSGDRAQIVIEAAWGMGAAIVDGRVTADRYVLARDGLRFLERRIADKRFMVPSRVDPGSPERLLPVPEERRRSETLRPDEVEQVARWSLRCEEHFGAPQDVEWAFTDGQFHLLQSRPITTVRRPALGEGVKGRYVLFKAIAENFTEPLTPLMSDLMTTFLPPSLAIIGGRIYIDLALARALLPLDMTDEDLADLLYMGARSPSAPARVSLRRLPTAATAALLGTLVFGVTFARMRGMPDDFMEQYRALCRRVEGDASLDTVESVLRLWFKPGLLDPIGRMPLFVNIGSLRFAFWLAVLKGMLSRWAPELGPDVAARLCSGTEGVLSAQMGREIAALADEARAFPRVAEVLATRRPEDALAALRAEESAAGFLARLEEFLAVHGHRAVREMELRTVRWNEDPAPVLGMIRNHLRSETSAVDLGKAERGRAEAEAEVGRAVARLPLERLGWRRRLVRWTAGRTRYYFKLRENSRFYHVMGLGVVRRKVLAAEAELLARGALKCRDDVFFLRLGELEALRAGRLGWRDVEDRVRERRMEHVRLAKVTPPRTIGIERRREAVADTAGGDVLAGQGASPGRYEGVARVILDPSVDGTLHPGEVLVAPYTDPAWTPLFLTAGAAVVEVGSYLSHAGTVAREYGMPCVVDVDGCTRRVRTGMRVAVDGDRGRVRILDGGGAE
jgi:phosphohistidine swiveling domain-containing protein